MLVKLMYCKKMCRHFRHSNLKNVQRNRAQKANIVHNGTYFFSFCNCFLINLKLCQHIFKSVFVKFLQIFDLQEVITEFRVTFFRVTIFRVTIYFSG